MIVSSLTQALPDAVCNIHRRDFLCLFSTSPEDDILTLKNTYEAFTGAVYEAVAGGGKLNSKLSFEVFFLDPGVYQNPHNTVRKKNAIYNSGFSDSFFKTTSAASEKLKDLCVSCCAHSYSHSHNPRKIISALNCVFITLYLNVISTLQKIFRWCALKSGPPLQRAHLLRAYALNLIKIQKNF